MNFFLYVKYFDQITFYYVKMGTYRCHIHELDISPRSRACGRASPRKYVQFVYGDSDMEYPLSFLLVKTLIFIHGCMCLRKS